MDMNNVIFGLEGIDPQFYSKFVFLVGDDILLLGVFESSRYMRMIAKLHT